ncbi:hypothetical protein JIG36_08845 [Actinoplanes sp. LDG1-06]|uniref:Uncharacterized protein n=1 Tax=Paractinoplanes ovalisporus TaxID=2810368 RepID=A0ABS2A736_9ACTN|nr:hypothetical protein [Actinoplanes ovalisporus]MBM2615658.1 hypothetical protein [Actinoplanes ovalisporus]
MSPVSGWSELQARVDGERDEVGRLMAVLVRATAASSLGRFPPYISMFTLRFGDPAEPATQPPVLLGVATVPDSFLVWWGENRSHRGATIMHQTSDVHEAVAYAEQLLATWPYRAGPSADDGTGAGTGQAPMP